MKDDFLNVLGISLMSDYYNLSYLTASKRGQGLNLLTSVHLCNQIAKIFSELGCKFSGYQYTEDPENFMWIEFASEEDKDIVDDYFQSFNLTIRKRSLICQPDVFEGQRAPKEEICQWYLRAIEMFFKNDFKNSISIPFGICEDNESERNFMVYSEEGMNGLYKGTDIFKNSSIRTVKNTFQ